MHLAKTSVVAEVFTPAINQLFKIWERDLEDDPVTHDLVTRFSRGEIWSYLEYLIINHPFHSSF